jgi:hypothetical protein
MAEASAQVDTILAEVASPNARAITAAARQLLLQRLPDDTAEYVDGNDIGYGWGPGYRDLIFVLTPHRNHATLGVSEGAQLADPDRILGGAGKRHRSLRLTALEQVQEPALTALIDRAVEFHRSRRTTG